MKEHYCTYEQAVALKRLGFDWDVRGYYTRDDNFQKVREITAHNHNDTQFKGLYSAPRLDQAAAWMRDCKGLHVSPDPYLVCDYDTGGSVYYERYLWSFELKKIPSGDYMKVADGGEYESYEQALSAGISAALELLGKEVKE